MYNYILPGITPAVPNQNRIEHVAVHIAGILAVVPVEAAGPGATVAGRSAAVAAVIAALLRVVQVCAVGVQAISI